MIKYSEFSHRSAANDDNDDGDDDDDDGSGGGDDIIIIIIIIIQSKCLYVLELTVAFESNLDNNAVHKKENI